MDKLVNYSSDEEHEDNWSKNAADSGPSHSPVHAPCDDYRRHHKTLEHSRSLGSSNNRNPKEQDERNVRNKQQYSSSSSSTHYRDDYGSSSSRSSVKMSEKTRSKDNRDDRRERNDDYRDERKERNDDYRSNRDSKNGRDTKDSRDSGRGRRGSSGGGGDDDRKRSDYRQYHQHHSSSTASNSSKYRDSRSGGGVGGDFEKNRSSSDYYRSHRESNKHNDNNDRDRNSFDRSDRYRKKRSSTPEISISSSSSSHSKRYSNSSGTSNRNDRRYRSRSKSKEAPIIMKTSRHSDFTSNGSGYAGRTLTTEAAVGLAAAKIAQELRKEMSQSPPLPSSEQISPQHLSKPMAAGILSGSGGGRTEALVSLPLNHQTGSKPPTPANLMPLMSVKTGYDNANNPPTTSITTVPPASAAPVALPSYYNPNVINPNKYAEQVQKRKLIWGAKKTEDASAKWGNAKFSQDSDGKVASKFMRLMGIKSTSNSSDGGAHSDALTTTKSSSSEFIDTTGTTAGASIAGINTDPTSGDVKSREAMFSKMEQQYEVARQVTHTMRGVGLGFGSQARQF